jgi:predicted ATPase/DNA-binding CsgD family transcriptional regulator
MTTFVISLPQERGSFIGRSDEIDRLVALLENAECRLVTLLGPGGAGKTRLSIETAKAFAEQNAADVYFVPLQPIDSVERVASAICDALNLRGGQDDPRERLLNFLAEKELLLVLDNFEHLLSGADLVLDILEAAPSVKILATSRESMRVGAEWRFDVEGLPSPVTVSRADPMSFAAVRLFVERARQVSPNFDPSESEIADIVTICSLVQGSPLAIEIAASWARSLSPSDIASEIERNITFLSTQMRDVAERHRSMQAVFAQSWENLSEEEQGVFKRLSVFRGGFTREAAAEIADASIASLSTLVDRSLIRQMVGGRYQVHEVLRQFAAAKLGESSDDERATHLRHMTYYTGLLRDRSLPLFGAKHQDAASSVREELDNLLSAFNRALEENDYEAIALSYHAIGNYFEVTSLYAEGYDALSRAMTVVRQSPSEHERVLLARILVDLGWNALRVGEVEASRHYFEESIALHDELNLDPVPGQATEPRTGMGVVELVRGNFAAARDLGHEALQICEASGQMQDVPYACYLLTSAYQQLGNYEQARVYAARAYEQARLNDDVWFLAYCLNEMGTVESATGDLDSARAHFRESFEIRREFDDPEGMAVALNCLGKVALISEAYSEATGHFTRSLAIYRQLADRGGLASSLKGLGEARTCEGALASAAAALREAMSTALSIGFVPMTLSVLACTVALLIRGRKEKAAGELLAWLKEQDGCDDETHTRITRLLEQVPVPDSPGVHDISQMVAFADSALIGLAEDASSTALHDALAEPLSDREKEVLEYIAQGKSNRQIADILIVSVGTIKAHTHNIYEKLDAPNRVQALARARELGIISA